VREEIAKIAGIAKNPNLEKQKKNAIGSSPLAFNFCD
jgi:hypothetical protein